MKKLGIGIDVIRDYETKFHELYCKKYIHNPNLIGDIKKGEEGYGIQYYTPEEEEIMEKKFDELEKKKIKTPITSYDLFNHYQFDEEEFEEIVFEDVDPNNVNMKLSGNISETQKKVKTPREVYKNFIEDYTFELFGEAPGFRKNMEYINRIQQFGLKNKLFEVIILAKANERQVPATYRFLHTIDCRILNVRMVQDDFEKWKYCDVLIDTVPESIQTKPKDKKVIKIKKDYNQWDKASFEFEDIKSIFDTEFLTSLFK